MEIQLFIKKILLFFTVISLILIIISILMKLYLMPFQDISLAKSIHFFENEANSIEIIFLGDSQIYYGINPVCISLKKIIHNFGFASEPIQTTYWKIEYYFDKHALKKLRLAIINLDYRNFTSESRVGINMDYDYYKYYNYYFMDLIKYMGFRDIIKLIANRIDILRWRPYFVNNIMNKIKKPNERIMSSGYGERKYSHITKLPSIRAADTYDKKPNHMNILFYNKLINLFREHGVEVMFIMMPDRFHRSSQGEVDLKAREKEDKFVDKLIKTNFPSIRLLRYHDRYKWQSDQFSDDSHLNDKGACILGELIKEDLSRIPFLKDQLH